MHTGCRTRRHPACQWRAGVMDLTALVSGHLRYLSLGSPLIENQLESELRAPVRRLGKERQLSPTPARKARSLHSTMQSLAEHARRAPKASGTRLDSEAARGRAPHGRGALIDALFREVRVWTRVRSSTLVYTMQPRSIDVYLPGSDVRDRQGSKREARRQVFISPASLPPAGSAGRWRTGVGADGTVSR